MINRYYKDGEKLDVAGLNEITVLLDRSETEFTEIGWNCWTPQQDGPPHKHNDKDQVFYVTGGIGIIKLGNEEYPAKEGCLAYVPAGLVHQTITTTENKLCYMLFNVFKSKNKEGHGTFKEHIEKVKQIRRKQADTGVTEVDEEIQLSEIKNHKYFTDINRLTNIDHDSNSALQLLHSNETNKNELILKSQIIGNKEAIVIHKDREEVFFILEGEGVFTIGNESEKVQTGHLVYLPRNIPYTSEATIGKLKYLRLSAIAEPDA